MLRGEPSVAVIPTSKGQMSAEQIVDELTYSSYRYNRSAHGMSAESGMKWYPNGEQMEARYQAELAIAKAAA